MKISKRKLVSILSGFPVSLIEFKRLTYIEHPVLGRKKTFTLDTKPLDHYKEIKKFYQYGEASFLAKYSEWFFKHHDKMVAKYPYHFIKVQTKLK